MKNKKYIVYLVVSILVLTIGVSYAYFKARVNGEGKSISLRSKGIYVLYSGDATLASESISPGWSETKEFTVENQGSNNEVYNIYIEGLVNTFVTSGYLQYKITSSNGYNMTEYKDIPKSNTSIDTVLAYSVPIKSKEKQTYKVELIYKETEEDQSADMGKILSGILGIQVGTKDPNLFTASVVVINGSSDTNSKEVYKGNDVTFTITPNDGYTLENASISCSNGTLSNNLLTISNVQSDVTCTITLGEDGPYKSGTLAAQILKDNPTVLTRTDFTTTIGDATGTIFIQSSTATNMMTEDVDGDGVGEDVYYYSGNTTNNWVKFGIWKEGRSVSKGTKYAGDKSYSTSIKCKGDGATNCTEIKYVNLGDDMYWRIIRINEDGSVRLLYSGNSTTTTEGHIGVSLYNTHAIKSYNVGYMYSNNGANLSGIRQNTSTSFFKEYIDTWYKTNLGDSKYISKTAIYCNDRSVSSGSFTIDASSSSGRSFCFGAIGRIKTNKHPSYICGGDGLGGLYESVQAVEDKFSSSTSSGGNGQLIYPVGTITADEFVYAGAIFETEKTDSAWYFKNSNDENILSRYMDKMMTMTPYCYVGGDYGSEIFVQRGHNSYLSYTDITEAYIVRPVISLKACVKYSSGDGSSSNPYEVTIDSTCENSEN